VADVQSTSLSLPVQEGIKFAWALGWPMYAVGDDGSVWSIKAKGGNDRVAGRLASRWHRLSECPNSHGYSCVNLFRDGVNHIVPVYVLVLEAFVGPRPVNGQACHFPDRNHRNNRLDNLRWDTQSGNQQDRKAQGTVTRLSGSRNPNATLTAEVVREIVRRRLGGEAYGSIADAVGTTKQNVWRICNGFSWTSVTGGPLRRFRARRRH
jgi:hypothetical protein